MSLKKILFFCVLLISLLIINNLVHSIYTLWQKEHLITAAKADLGKEKKEWQTLQGQLKEVKEPQFVEEEARNKLLLAKPGEGIIVIPTQPASASAKPVARDTRQNWQKWWDVFF